MHSRIEPSGCGRRGVYGQGIVWGSVVLVAILLFSGAADAQLMNSAWAKELKDENNSGISPYSSTSTGEIKWNFTEPNDYSSDSTSPVVGSDGTIYFVFEFCSIIDAFYPNGTLKWRFDPDDSHQCSYQSYWSPALSSDGILYEFVGGGWQTRYPALFAIYADNGSLRNKGVNFGINSHGTSVSIDNDNTVFFSVGNKLYAYYADNLTEKWNFSASTKINYESSVIVGNSIFFGTYSFGQNHLYSLDSNTGVEKWNISTGNVGGISQYNNILYYVVGSMIYAVDLNGNEIENFTADNNIDDSVKVYNNLLYFGTWSTYYILYPNFTIKASTGINGNQYSKSVIDANGIIYFGKNNGVFHAIYAENLTEKWNKSVGGDDFYSFPAIGINGDVYIGNGNNNPILYAFGSPAPASFDPSGYVKDTNGNALPGATLVFGSYSTASNGTGWYDFGNIANGTYSYSVSRTGYNSQTGSIDIQHGGSPKNWALTPLTPPSPQVTISCPAAGWCYAASDYSSKTLLQLDNIFSTDTIQGHYNATSQKYESHRTGYNFNQNVSVVQKEGYYYYFSTATDITTTPGSTPSITLKVGWNLVGNYGSSARTLSALKSSIGVSATQAQYYDKTLKTWVTSDSQSVPAMESFFVYVTSPTPWSG